MGMRTISKQKTSRLNWWRATWLALIVVITLVILWAYVMTHSVNSNNLLTAGLIALVFAIMLIAALIHSLLKIRDSTTRSAIFTKRHKYTATLSFAFGFYFALVLFLLAANLLTAAQSTSTIANDLQFPLYARFAIYSLIVDTVLSIVIFTYLFLTARRERHSLTRN